MIWAPGVVRWVVVVVWIDALERACVVRRKRESEWLLSLSKVSISLMLHLFNCNEIEQSISI
jgi:hypothetical protein